MFNSFKKYGESEFGFEYIEVFERDEDLLFDRELFWMDYYDTCNRDKGYNLRRDSSTMCETHAETRLLLSENMKGENNPNFGNHWNTDQKLRASEIAKRLHAEGRYNSDEQRMATSIRTSKFWADNPEKKEIMAKKVSENRSKLSVEQYDKHGNLIRVWDTFQQLREAHPDYYIPAIYNCCGGYKKSYKGFIWKSIPKI